MYVNGSDTIPLVSFNPQYQVLCEQSHPSSQIRVVLEDAIKHHPNALYLQLELVRLIIREAVSDAELIKGILRIMILLNHKPCWYVFGIEEPFFA